MESEKRGSSVINNKYNETTFLRVTFSSAKNVLPFHYSCLSSLSLHQETIISPPRKGHYSVDENNGRESKLPPYPLDTLHPVPCLMRPVIRMTSAIGFLNCLLQKKLIKLVWWASPACLPFQKDRYSFGELITLAWQMGTWKVGLWWSFII